jgi:5-formyltetrahydrofolate cyclo-ligase
VANAVGWNEIRDWRRRVRDDLLERRMALGTDARHALGERARAQLLRAVDFKDYRVLGICWPIRGGFDVMGLAKEHAARGGEVALPVVVQKSEPVEFWRWRPGMPMQKGIWNIPIPKERNVLIPDVVIVPLVGFDESVFRLGYGGGHFDRTLARDDSATSRQSAWAMRIQLLARFTHSRMTSRWMSS